MLSLQLFDELGQFGSVFTDFETRILSDEDDFRLCEHFSVAFSLLSCNHFLIVDGTGTWVLLGSMTAELSEFLESSVAPLVRADEWQHLIFGAGAHSRTL